MNVKRHTTEEQQRLQRTIEALEMRADMAVADCTAHPTSKVYRERMHRIFFEVSAAKNRLQQAYAYGI